MREFFEPRLGLDLRAVQFHTDSEAAELAGAMAAGAVTIGSDVFFGFGQFLPQTGSGRRLIAHELAHVAQIGELGTGTRVLRETATDVKERYKDYGGLNLREEDLGSYLVSLARQGQYGFVEEVFGVLDWSDKDDVAVAMMSELGTLDLIRMARSEAGVSMLRRMAGELTDWPGFITTGERSNADLLRAVIQDGADRVIWNQHRIEDVRKTAGSDLEALALLFEDDQIVDNGSVIGRWEAVRAASEHLAIPGLQTGIEFGDTGFSGTQEPGGPGFRDPHASSRNQVGHFLTAVGLEISPQVVSRKLPVFGSIREMIQAPRSMTDEEVALRLTIGHEKAPDPNGTMAAIDVMLAGVIEHMTPGPEGETEEERNERVGRAIAEETRRQIAAIIAAFRTQFQVTTDADLQAWNEALASVGTEGTLDMTAAEEPLSRIPINYANRGNSIQDLRLSLVGWRMGQLLQAGQFGSRADVAAWIRRNLGAGATSSG